MDFFAIDIFSGCGGLTEGMHQANFKTQIAFEIDEIASLAYRLNHPSTRVITKDIRKVTITEIKRALNGKKIHLLAGCPPCQGFSSIRRLNRLKPIDDNRNNLILEYLRIVKALKPHTIMMENVPGLKDYYLFKNIINELKILGYNIDIDIVNVKDYGVPQNRKRLVVVGSLFGEINIARGVEEKVSVRQAIGHLESTETTKDALHKINMIHNTKVLERIKLIPKNGGSWRDLPDMYKLNCHKKNNVGFNDIYGRLRWDDFSSTITGGCINPSKGRFLHPEEDRVITPREAALLQSFPSHYKFPIDIPKAALALLIGNALPPKFSYIQSKNIMAHLSKYLN